MHSILKLDQDISLAKSELFTKKTYQQIVKRRKVSFDAHVYLEAKKLESLVFKRQKFIIFIVYKHRYQHPKGFLFSYLLLAFLAIRSET